MIPRDAAKGPPSRVALLASSGMRNTKTPAQGTIPGDADAWLDVRDPRFICLTGRAGGFRGPAEPSHEGEITGLESCATSLSDRQSRWFSWPGRAEPRGMSAIEENLLSLSLFSVFV